VYGPSEEDEDEDAESAGSGDGDEADHVAGGAGAEGQRV
jgi:hypothetical protein